MGDEAELRAVRRKVRVAALRALEDLGGRGSRAEIREHVLRHGDFSAAARALPARAGSFIDEAFRWALFNLRQEELVTNPRDDVWVLRRPEPVVVVG